VGLHQNMEKKDDPWVGFKAGGLNVFGGGLALYNNRGKLIGGLGISGDTSCNDHIVSWKLRYALNLDNVPAGVAPTPGSTKTTDNMINDVTLNQYGNLNSASNWGHPNCSAAGINIVATLAVNYPVGPKDSLGI